MVISIIENLFENVISIIPGEYKTIVGLLFYTISIVVYTGLIWKFYKFLAKRDILELNLKQYNHSLNPGLERFLAIILYTLEYIIILPFLVFFWFSVFSVFLLILSKHQSVQQILLISSAIIASTRITSYFNEELSRDLAKIFPFTALILFLSEPNFFNIDIFTQRVLEIPQAFEISLIFAIFIFFIELIMRGFYSFFQIFGSQET